jgi:hypothetical protein
MCRLEREMMLPVFDEEMSGLEYDQLLKLRPCSIDFEPGWSRPRTCLRDISVQMQAGGKCHDFDTFTANRNRSSQL